MLLTKYGKKTRMKTRYCGEYGEVTLMSEQAETWRRLPRGATARRIGNRYSRSQSAQIPQFPDSYHFSYPFNFLHYSEKINSSSFASSHITSDVSYSHLLVRVMHYVHGLKTRPFPSSRQPSRPRRRSLAHTLLSFSSLIPPAQHIKPKEIILRLTYRS